MRRVCPPAEVQRLRATVQGPAVPQGQWLSGEGVPTLFSGASGVSGMCLRRNLQENRRTVGLSPAPVSPATSHAPSRPLPRTTQARPADTHGQPRGQDSWHDFSGDSSKSQGAREAAPSPVAGCGCCPCPPASLTSTPTGAGRGWASGRGHPGGREVVRHLCRGSRNSRGGLALTPGNQFRAESLRPT